MAIALANQKIKVLHPDVLDSGVGLRVEAITSTISLGTRLPMLSLAVPSSHTKTNSNSRHLLSHTASYCMGSRL